MRDRERTPRRALRPEDATRQQTSRCRGSMLLVGQSVGAALGAGPPTDPTSCDGCGTTRALLPARPSRHWGQAQLAVDPASLVKTLEAQKGALADLSRHFSAISERVAAWDEGPPQPADDGAISMEDSDGIAQRAECARSASAKARPWSSPAPAAPQRDSGSRRFYAFAAHAPSNDGLGLSGWVCGGSSFDLVGSRRAAWRAQLGRPISRALLAGTLAPVEVVTLPTRRIGGVLPLVYHRSMRDELKAAAIGVQPPAIRRRGVALSPLLTKSSTRFRASRPSLGDHLSGGVRSRGC